MARRRKKSNIIKNCILILIFLGLIGALLYPVWKNYMNKKSQDSDTTKVETEIPEQQDNNVINTESDVKPEETEKQKIPQYDGEDPNLAAELSGAITFAEVVDGKLMIRMNIDQYLSDGECELTLKRDSSIIYTNTVNIVSNASTSSCEGFDVPTNILGTGKIEIVINLDANNKKGVINGEANL